MKILRLLLVALLGALPGCLSAPWVSSMSVSTSDVASDAGQPTDSDLTVSPRGESSGLTMPMRRAPSVSQTALLDRSSTEPESPTVVATTDDTVLRELQTIGLVDPAAAQRLVEQLQSVEPSLRPLAAEQFRSSWQFHRELSSRNATPSPLPFPDPTGHRHPNSTPTSPLIPFVEPSVVSPVLGQSSSTDGREAAKYNPADYQSPAPSVPQIEQPKRPSAAGMAQDNANQQEVVPASYEELPRQLPPTELAPTESALAESAKATSQDWREVVALATDRLAASTTDDPRSTRDAYLHARLRLLQLVGGNNDLAMVKIPGLTPTEQNYWSNQIFALSTLLDHQQQPDEGQRAALAGGSLADAAAQLGQLSALSVRNLAFCKEVFGYGDYDSADKMAFKPGQEVTLYAEMENFRSESTEKGYHTSLATSYEVLDQNGNRVEEGEFATVDDYCQRHRRDFYIEYTLELPSRIYASRYQLRLMVRDRLSGKIGKATVDFEIKE